MNICGNNKKKKHPWMSKICIACCNKVRYRVSSTRVQHRAIRELYEASSKRTFTWIRTSYTMDTKNGEEGNDDQRCAISKHNMLIGLVYSFLFDDNLRLNWWKSWWSERRSDREKKAVIFLRDEIHSFECNQIGNYFKMMLW